MKKRLIKKKMKQIADKMADWYVNEFLPLRDKKRQGLKNKKEC
jgi:hypothetical protein